MVKKFAALALSIFFVATSLNVSFAQEAEEQVAYGKLSKVSAEMISVFLEVDVEEYSTQETDFPISDEVEFENFEDITELEPGHEIEIVFIEEDGVITVLSLYDYDKLTDYSNEEVTLEELQMEDDMPSDMPEQNY